MKKLVLLLGALALFGCGEKTESGVGAIEAADSSLDSQAAGDQTEESSADTTNPPAAESPNEEASESPNSLSDADVERLMKEAIDSEAGFEMGEDGGLVAPNGSGPFSGWIKFLDEYGKGLQRFKDGKANGPRLRWYKNGKLGEEEAWDNGELVAVTVRMPNGDKCPNTKFENGSGIVYAYWENGQKAFEGTYKDGKESGLHTSWHKNGQKEYEATYKDGQLDGLETQYYENGQKELEVTYKDGKEDGPQTQYYENGQKMSEATFIDGKFNGLETMWHENGQKQSEVSWKDNVGGSAKYWNSKGEEVDSEEEAFK